MQNWTVKITLLLISCLAVMAAATLAPCLPLIAEHFSDQPSAPFLCKLMLTAPAIFIALSAPIAGCLIDTFGRKRLLLTSLFLYGVSGSAGFFLNDLYLLIFSRFLLGIATAGVLTTATVLISDYFMEEQKEKLIKIQAGVMAFSNVMLLNIGGIFSDFSWRAPFLVYSTALLLIPLAWYSLTEPAATASVAPLAKKTANRKILAVYFLVFVCSALCYIIPTQLPFLMQKIASFTSSQNALLLSLTNIAGVLSCFAYTRSQIRWSNSLILSLIFFFVGVGFVTVALASHYMTVAVGLVIAGLGIGLMLPNANLWIISLAPTHLKGRFIGGLTTAFYLGEFFSPLMVQPFNSLGLSTIFGILGMMMAIAPIPFVLNNLGPQESKIS